MGVDELELLVLGHRVRDRTGPGEQPRGIPERAGGDEARQEPGGALEQRGDGRRAGVVVEPIEDLDRDRARHARHEPR